MDNKEGGAPNDQDGVNDQTDNKADKDLVPKSEHQRALDDLHKFKKQAKELQTQLENANSSRLKEKEDFKTLAETYEKKWKEESELHAKTKQSVEYNHKYTAAYSALKKEGLMDEAEKLLDKDGLEELVIENTDQGRYIIHGKDALVQRWKKDLPFAFKSATPPKINPGGGKTTDISDKEVTAASVFEAEKQYKAGKLPKEDYIKVVSLFKNRKKA